MYFIQKSTKLSAEESCKVFIFDGGRYIYLPLYVLLGFTGFFAKKSGKTLSVPRVMN